MRVNLQRLLITILMLGYSGCLFAQTHTITGKVTDSETGLGIPGATILEQGTTNGTSSNLDGNYSITVSNPNARLEVSFVGYKTTIVDVNNQNVIDIILIFQTTELEELVVIGYGVQKKKVVTGAIASVSADEISATPILRIDQAMQGRTPGVLVTNLSG